jgi:cytochrome c biogenesis protein CcmG/thiol:disulfide interchange protein DsbE
VRRLCVLFLVAASACGGAPKAVPQQTLVPGKVVAGSADILKKTLASMRGQPVVVNYWATWCIPCRTEMPRIVQAASQYGSRVRFLGIDVEDDTKTADDYAHKRGVQYPMLSDPHGAIRSAQRIVGLPVTQFYRSDGQLAYVNNGEIQALDLKKRIDDLLLVGRPVPS